MNNCGLLLYSVRGQFSYATKCGRTADRGMPCGSGRILEAPILKSTLGPLISPFMYKCDVSISPNDWVGSVRNGKFAAEGWRPFKGGIAHMLNGGSCGFLWEQRERELLLPLFDCEGCVCCCCGDCCTCPFWPSALESKVCGGMAIEGTLIPGLGGILRLDCGARRLGGGTVISGR